MRISGGFLAAACAALMLVPASSQAEPSPVAHAAKKRKLSQARAELAVASKVERVYRNKIGNRVALADCTRISRTYFDCEYLVTKNGDDGYEEGRDGGGDGSPWKYSGTGSARLTKSGALLVRVSRPR